MTHSSMALSVFKKFFVLKLPGLKLEEGLEKPWDFLEEVENERNHVYGA